MSKVFQAPVLGLNPKAPNPSSSKFSYVPSCCRRPLFRDGAEICSVGPIVVDGQAAGEVLHTVPQAAWNLVRTYTVRKTDQAMFDRKMSQNVEAMICTTLF